MRPNEWPVRTSSLLAVALFLAASLGAQTLEHRPQPKPEAPVQTLAPVANQAALAPITPFLPQGTSLQVEIARPYPMRAGETIEGRLLHPIFAQGVLAVPESTLLHGTVIALQPDSKTRWHARLRGDFTPFHTVQVQFNELMLPGGALPIATGRAANGAPVLHLAAPAATPKQSLFTQAWLLAKERLHERVAYVTAPGRGDRALQALYHQLPYHPERIPAHTAWTFELTAPLALPETAATAQLPAAPSQPGKPETWSVHALLKESLTSASAKSGDAVEALVVEPVFDRDRQLVVPQGSVLVGKVTAAKAARSLGRSGKLRFTFQQVRFPEGGAPNRPVQGALAGATAESEQGLSLDAEGTITPRNHSSIINPLLLTALAGRALDEDGHRTAQTAVASNGFGLVGRVVGIAAGNRNLAAGIGYYASALSFYENFLRPGRNVAFPKDTRIEIETTPMRAPVLKPSQQ
ncbi:MAG: hypothetical protein P4K86_09195 [Terracidiphilus sp.]|nr:hypothetical protein [Terracidiphilus sp.]MDR3777103.1 hypothetical protein [Terracidiphilus sp.]